MYEVPAAPDYTATHKTAVSEISILINRKMPPAGVDDEAKGQAISFSNSALITHNCRLQVVGIGIDRIMTWERIPSNMD